MGIVITRYNNQTYRVGHLLAVSPVKLVRGSLLPVDLVHPIGLVVVSCDDDASKKSLLHTPMEVGSPAHPLVNLLDLVIDSVSPNKAGTVRNILMSTTIRQLNTNLNTLQDTSQQRKICSSCCLMLVTYPGQISSL